MGLKGVFFQSLFYNRQTIKTCSASHSKGGKRKDSTLAIWLEGASSPSANMKQQQKMRINTDVASGQTHQLEGEDNKEQCPGQPANVQELDEALPGTADAVLRETELVWGCRLVPHRCDGGGGRAWVGRIALQELKRSMFFFCSNPPISQCVFKNK